MPVVLDRFMPTSHSPRPTGHRWQVHVATSGQIRQSADKRGCLTPHVCRLRERWGSAEFGGAVWSGEFDVGVGEQFDLPTGPVDQMVVAVAQQDAVAVVARPTVFPIVDVVGVSMANRPATPRVAAFAIA